MEKWWKMWYVSCCSLLWINSLFAYFPPSFQIDESYSFLKSKESLLIFFNIVKLYFLHIFLAKWRKDLCWIFRCGRIQEISCTRSPLISSSSCFDWSFLISFYGGSWCNFWFLQVNGKLRKKMLIWMENW